MTQRREWLARYIDEGKAGALEAPPFVSWVVTRACNLGCYYCFTEARKRDPDELSTAEALEVIEDLADHGVFLLSYIGGEPLMRKDIYQLIDYSTDLGIYASLLTNGLLVKEGTIERLKDAGCQMVGVSVDNTDPIVHDGVRGARGSLEGAQRAVRDAIRADLRSSVRVVVTEESLGSLESIFRWALDEGVEELIVIPIFMVGRAAGTTDDRRADVLGKERFFEALRRLRDVAEPLGMSVPHENIACATGIELNPPDAERHHTGHAVGFNETVGCKVGRFIANVGPNGDVYPCPYVQHRIGNLRTQSMGEIWGAPLLQTARTQDLGCIARSIIHTGRADAVDPTYDPDTGDSRSTVQLLGGLNGAT